MISRNTHRILTAIIQIVPLTAYMLMDDHRRRLKQKRKEDLFRELEK